MKKPIEQTPYVFVYGTLMSGMGNSGYLGDSKLITTATTKENYTLLANSLPFLVDNENSDYYVSGEVYEVSSDILVRLDSLEGHPTWYSRKIITVIDEIGDSLQAWAYFMPESNTGNAVNVTSGNYRDYSNKQFINDLN